MRLTKRKLVELNLAMTMDEVLYEKFRRLHEELERQRREIYKAKQVVRVIQQRGKINHVLQIIDIQVTPEGTFVVCR